MRFYVNTNAQPNGDHEVHRSTCAWLPDVENRIYLGDFATSQAAVREARKYYSQETAATTAALKAIRLDSRDGPPVCGRAIYILGVKNDTTNFKTC